MPRLKLTVAYEGSNYSGWQLQAANGDLAAGPPTVQGELERCVRTLVGTRVPVHGAGRTDSGVHAEGQVCHLDLPEDTRRIDWRRAMNVQLPPDVRVLNATWVDAGFHARKSARGKRYAYTLWSHRERAVPRIRSFVWSCPPLDMEKLRPVFPCLVGTRDFATFRNSGGNDGRTIRTLSSIELLPGVAANLTCARDWPVTKLIF